MRGVTMIYDRCRSFLLVKKKKVRQSASRDKLIKKMFLVFFFLFRCLIFLFTLIQWVIWMLKLKITGEHYYQTMKLFLISGDSEESIFSKWLKENKYVKIFLSLLAYLPIYLINYSHKFFLAKF